MNSSIVGFDQRMLRRTLVQVRTSDGKVHITDRNDTVLSTLEKTHLNDDISRFGFIVNSNPDLQVGSVSLVTNDTENLRICFGSQDAAADLNTLQQLRVTHIVNLVAALIPNQFPDSFEYLDLNLLDELNFSLRPAIATTCEFIANRVIPNHGTIFVHCNAGQSRAPAIVIACLIRLSGLPYDEAFRIVNNARTCSPNLNFKMQLRALAEETNNNNNNNTHR